MTGVRVGLASPRPAQLGDPALARWIGLGFVALLGLTMLVLVVRYGSERDRGGSDSGRVFDPGPAYGLTGSNDVEEVLRIDDPDAADGGGDGTTQVAGDGADGTAQAAGGGADGAAEASPGAEGTPDRRRADDRRRGSASGSGTGRSAAGEDAAGDDPEFTHDVRERGDEEWLVEVTDGDRSARFRVSRVGSVLTIDPVASPAQRHGSNWVLRAERYLRDQELAVATERE